MSRNPTLSVVLPVYNGASTLLTTLDSIQNQTWAGEMEVVVIDDGSTDASAAVAEQHPLETRVIRQENTGVTGARRTGIEAADGEWIAFVDADDVWLPEKLERQMEALEAQDRPALSFTRYIRVDRSAHDGDSDAEIAQPTHPEVDLDARPRRLAYRNFIANSTAIAHRECLERADLYPTADILNRGGQDYALWLRIAAYFPLVYVPEVLTEYGVHADNRVGTDPVNHLRGALAALRDAHRWAPVRFRGMAGAPYEAVVAARVAKFMRDAVVYRDVWPEDAASRGARVAAAFLTG